MPQNRRTFLATLGVATLGTLSNGRLAGMHGAQVDCRIGARVMPETPPSGPLQPRERPQQGPSQRTLEHRGVQLYTIRREMAQDLAGTLQHVAATGFREVEFAGYFGHAPAQVRELLAGSGLDAPSAHVPFNALNAGWDRALEVALEVGHRFVTVPSVPQGVRGGLDDWKRTAGVFNRAAAAARAAGLGFAYHNHDFEFAVMGDVVAFDILIAETDPALVSFELDLYWVTRAGHDPLTWLSRHPGRFSMLHLKDSAGPPDHRMTEVGAGMIDFVTILDHAEATGVRHAFVEHDRPDDALASIRSSLDYLNRIRPPGG